MTWEDKLIELTARIDAAIVRRDELVAMIDLGEAPTWQARLDRLNDYITTRTTERDSLAVLLAADQDPALIAQIAALTADLATANADLATATASLSTANATIATRDATIVTRDATIVFLETTAEGLSTQIDDLNSQITFLNAQIQALLDQIAGVDTFIAFDQGRIGDLSADGFTDLLTVYESSMVKPGDANTDPPDAAFLNTFFSGLKAANPTVNRVCLDYEAWSLITGSTASSVNATVVGYYVTLVNAAKAHFSDVGLYGEIPERYTNYLNYPPTHATHISRKNSWFSRNALMQDIWDAVDTIYPSCYYINPVHTDAADRDLWLTDQATLCSTHAPGKKAYTFLWPRVHTSVDPAETYINGDYYAATLDKVFELFDGYVLWLFSADVHPETVSPVPLWWTRTLERHATWGIIP
jgi:hypothetical protein